jgi:hypothetical protein
LYEDDGRSLYQQMMGEFGIRRVRIFHNPNASRS